MITINSQQFHKLMMPMPQEYNAEQFMQALEDKYCIKDMIAHDPINTSTSWDLDFVSPYAEFMFRLTYSEYL